MPGLRRLRKERRITQAKLANVVGVQQSTVSMWETGEAYPRKDNIDELCKFFDCKIDDLL